MEKGSSITSLMVALVVALAFAIQLCSVEATSNRIPDNLPWIARPSACTGTIEECLAATGGEFDLDSETNRRILASRIRYISYASLRRNSVPCSRRRTSYYGCGAGATGNPYRRGCSAITKCR